MLEHMQQESHYITILSFLFLVTHLTRIYLADTILDIFFKFPDLQMSLWSYIYIYIPNFYIIKYGVLYFYLLHVVVLISFVVKNYTWPIILPLMKTPIMTQFTLYIMMVISTLLVTIILVVALMSIIIPFF